MKDYEYGFGASSGSGYANVKRPERARERDAEWRLQQQQGWGFDGGNGGGFGPSGRGGLGPSEWGRCGGQEGYVRVGGPRRAQMPPPLAVTPLPPPHFQALMLGERKGRYWGIPGSSLQGQVEVQDSGVSEFCNPPPPQHQQQQQQLEGFSERNHRGYGTGLGLHQGAMHSIPISQAQEHGSVGGVGRVGVGVGIGVPSPLSTPSFPLDTTRYYLLGQLEYYLSPQNMAQDFYLRKQMDTRGWIPIPLIASFNRVRQLNADVQLVREVLTLSSVVQVCGGMVRMDGWESFVLPGAPVSEVEGERQEENRQELQQHQYEQHPPHDMVGSTLWQGTRYEEECTPPLSLEDKNGGSADNGHGRRALVNGHSDHLSSFAVEASVKEHKELEDEEEEKDVVFVTRHEVGTTWSPKRRT